MADQPEQPDRRSPNGGSRPIPDPTVLTAEAIARSDQAMRDYIDGQLAIRDQRLSGMDEATKLRLGGIDSMEDTVDLKVGRLADVTDEKFHSVNTRFDERDTRSERESRDNKVAVDAAFAAQKEAAAKQDEANAKAIDKSERATAETIKTNQDLNAAITASLTKSIDELKQAVTRIESRGIGASETRIEGRMSTGAMVGLGSLVVGVVLAIVAVVSLLPA